MENDKRKMLRALTGEKVELLPVLSLRPKNGIRAVVERR
jgi:hypothetical protein